MIAENLIAHTVPSLKTSDTAEKALHLMDEFRVSHLPIVNNIELLGLISDEDIHNLNVPDEPIWNHKLSLIKPFVYNHQHIYDVIKVIGTDRLSVVPVLNEKENYMGVITMMKLVQNFSKMAAINDPGGMIILELNQHDYYLSQIVQIIESNDAKVLSTYIHSHPDSTKMNLTIKVNRTDLGAILQTFNRYNYNVKETYSEDIGEDDLKDRFDAFMNYINM